MKVLSDNRIFYSTASIIELNLNVILMKVLSDNHIFCSTAGILTLLLTFLVKDGSFTNRLQQRLSLPVIVKLSGV